MTWVVEITGPGPEQNRVELRALSSGVCAVVGGKGEWETRPEAHAALYRYRAAKEREAAIAAGQKELFG